MGRRTGRILSATGKAGIFSQKRRSLARAVAVGLGISSASSLVSAANINVTVTNDNAVEYQTIQGWGSIYSPNKYVPDDLRAELIDVGVNDLGLSRFRLEMPAGYATDNQRWEFLNDNSNAALTDFSKFNLATADARISEWVVPAKAAADAAGLPYNFYVSPSFYTSGSSGGAPAWLQSPGEYAEFAMAYLKHMKDTFGIEPDYWVICNEANNGNVFDPALVGRMIKALGPKMAAAGYKTKIQFGEGVNPAATVSFINALGSDPLVMKYVGAVSYHLYVGGTDAAKAANLAQKVDIAAFAAAHNLPTAQTEIITQADNSLNIHIADIYDDLVRGNVSFSEVYGKGFPNPDLNRTSFTRASDYWAYRQLFHYVTPGSVRVDSTSTFTGNGTLNSTIKTLAFTKNGEQTTVIINTDTSPGNLTITGLTPGIYGTVKSFDNGAMQELGLKTVGANGNLTLLVEARSASKNATVYTLYPHGPGNWAPTVTGWDADAPFLYVPGTGNTTFVTGGTTLRATGTDSELDALTFHWSLVSAPTGANVNFATPNTGNTTVSGLTLEGRYTFAVGVKDATHEEIVKNVMLNVYNGYQAPQVELNIRTPIELTIPTGANPSLQTTLQSNVVDADSTTFTYQWSVVSKPAGSNPSLTSPTANQTTATSLIVAGNYLFRLLVTDETGVQTTREMLVTVNASNANAPTITNAKGTIVSRRVVTLSANVTDADGDAVSLWWEVVNGPNDDYIFSNQTGATTTFTALTEGFYTFQLVAVDRSRITTSSQFIVALPEPSCLAFGGLGLSLALRRARRSRRGLLPMDERKIAHTITVV
ncbi:hypothetical protein BH10PLA1_BH10PLA1_13340 [soil metagenome]